MTKLDSNYVNSDGHGKPVPVDMDRQIIKYILDQRKEAIERNPILLTTYRWDHSDVFYAARTHLNRNGWDTSVYNDNVAGGSRRRKQFYDMIKDVCESHCKVKRHQIGIYPEERAIMAYDGSYYPVSFDRLQSLMLKGTDVIVVEKQGTVMKMVPYTKDTGIALIQSQGFVSEYEWRWPGYATKRETSHWNILMDIIRSIEAT